MYMLLAGLDCCVTNVSRSRRATTRPLPVQLSSIPLNDHRQSFERSQRSNLHHTTRELPKTAAAKTSSTTSPYNFQKTFVKALVSAGECQRHRRLSRTGLQHTDHLKSQFSTIFGLSSHTRQFSTRSQTPGQAQATATYEVSKEEVGGLIDQYTDYGDSLAETNGKKTANLFNYTPSTQPDPIPKPPLNDEDTQRKIHILQQQLENPETPHDQIWETYQDLPTPRPSRLPAHLLRAMFHHLSVLEYKSTLSMSRYLSLVEETRAASIPLTASQWTSAISFAGRFVKNITSTEVESAMQLWRQMEQEAGIKATSVTFNVLFDVATKARKFILAEMIMKEMQGRQLPITRFFRTSLIVHYGLRGDGDAVRRAYKELVDAGEIVDSVVITCVVKALLSCGEAVAAEQVFGRAKRLHLEKTGAQLPPQNWRKKREIGRMLDAATRQQRHNSSFRVEAEAAAPLAPQLSTYKALVFHYAIQAGDLDRITELVDEMRHWGIAMHGALYMYIFRGFATHGGVLYTAWSRRRLEQTWKSLLTGIDYEKGVWGGAPVQQDVDMEDQSIQNTIKTNSTSSMSLEEDGISLPSSSTTSSTPSTPNIYPTRALMLVVLRAFLKVAGPERTWDVWSEAQQRWSPPDEDSTHIEEQLEAMMPDRDQSGKSPEEEIKGHVEGLQGMGDEWE